MVACGPVAATMRGVVVCGGVHGGVVWVGGCLCGVVVHCGHCLVPFLLKIVGLWHMTGPINHHGTRLQATVPPNLTVG